MDFSLTKNALNPKLLFKGYQKEDFTGAFEEFTVQYNPSEFSRSFEAEYESEEANGKTDSPQKFKRIKPSDLALSFTLDGTGASGEKIDVVEQLSQFQKTAYEYDGKIHRPRYVHVTWGNALNFRGVVKNVAVKYTLFTAEGSPLRVKVDVTMSSSKDYNTQIAEDKPESPDMTHMRVVKEGENLPLLSYEIYGDSRYYLDVAKVNGIINHRKLKAGSKVYFPPLKEVAE